MDDGTRPKSYFYVIDSTWNRNKVIVHLSYLQNVKDLATRPQVVGISGIGGIVVPGKQKKLKIQTSAGFDAGHVERLQADWFENPDIVKKRRCSEGN